MKRLNIERIILVAILLISMFETGILIANCNKNAEAKPIEQKEGYFVEVEEIPQELLELRLTNVGED